MMHAFTPLPFGGGVLLDTVTLAICECDEPEGDLVARALAGDDDTEVQRMVDRLHEAGWQLAVQDRR